MMWWVRDGPAGRAAERQGGNRSPPTEGGGDGGSWAPRVRGTGGARSGWCGTARTSAPGRQDSAPSLGCRCWYRPAGVDLGQAKREPGEDPAALAGGGTPPGCAALAGQARRE